MGHALPDGKRFFCREWVFSKLLHSLENLQKELEESTELQSSALHPPTPAPAATRRTGILIVGGPGAGKSSLCSEIILPTVTQGKQWTLRKSLLAYHFCQANDCDTLSVSEFVLRLAEQLSTSPLIPEYRLKLEEPNIRDALVNLSHDPDGAFKEVVLLPLLELNKPKQCCFILVDSIDESSYGSGRSSSHRDHQVPSTPSSSKKSSSIEELLLNNIDLFPPWLIPIFTARKQNKSSQISGFRKISLDDLRKPQVVRDVQQYILLRLDQDSTLRQHITRETADMLNQLHIKSNGCFLYIEKVLDGVSDNFISLREIRDIPGTLNGLYLWMCQRLFTRKQFSKVGCILSVLLASRKPLLEEELFLSLQMRNKAMSREDFRKRMQVLKRVVVKLSTGYVVIFHHSFAEWLLDVKYCSQKFLCQVDDGHAMLAILFSHLAPHLQEKGITELAHHLLQASMLDSDLLTNLILSAGSNVRLLTDLSQVDPKVGRLLSQCIVTEEYGRKDVVKPQSGQDEEDEEEPEEQEESITNEAKASLFEGGGEGPCEAEESTGLSVTGTDEMFQAESANLQLSAEYGQFVRVEERKRYSGSSYLHDAAATGNFEVVEYLLNTGVDVNEPDKNGRTPLHLAARHGHEDVAALFLDAHCEVDPLDKDLWTPLCACSSQGHHKLVILLLESNAAVNQRDRDGATPLLMAAFEGHLKVCETLLEYMADIDCCDKVGRNPLWAAASMGHCAVAELLLFWGAYVDHIDGDGRTVLSVAAAQGNVGVVKLLLARGLDEGHRDNLGWTPLHYAAFEGHREVCEALIEAGARVNDVDNDGYHGLLLAAQEGHLLVVKSLINHEAYLDHRSHDGQTALRVAATEGFKDIVQLLVSQGANVNYCDMDGRSTLYLLALENRVRMAQFLIFCGADVEARDFEGRTPLHVSSWQGHMKMVELLLSAGAVVDALDNDKRTPLQNAAWEGHDNIVRLLCERGSEVDHMCNQGATALCISVQCGHIECVKVLLEYGANPRRSDRSGRTPIKVAQKSGHTAITRLLEQAIQSGLKSISVDAGSEEIQKCERMKPRQESSTQGILDSNTEYHGEVNTHQLDHHEISNRTSVSPHSPILPPIASPKLDKENPTTSTGSANHQINFAKQVQQLSRRQCQEQSQRSRQPTSPLYSSPPPLSPTNGKREQVPLHFGNPCGPPSNVNRTYSNDTGLEAKKPFDDKNGVRGMEDNRFKPALESYVRPLNSTPSVQPSPFAFTRDSHMKIILGSNETNSNFLSKPTKKGPLGYIQNGSGISNATNVIRSGLSALRAGVLEAKAGKKSGHTSPLVSAASLAVPNVVVHKSKAGTSSSDNSAFPKKETQI